MNQIAVIGAGSWGTALAVLLARNGVHVRLWGNEPDQLDRMRQTRCNDRYLPGIALPERLSITDDLEEAVSSCDDILLVVPSHAFRMVLERLHPLLRDGARLAGAAKGFEQGTHKLLHEVVEEVCPGHDYAVVSGPTFALEVARGLPTAVTVASRSTALAEDWAACLHNDSFRAYTSDDVIGLEIGGAVKNVMAIAAGISDGLGFGANTRAALITRGLHEIMLLGSSLGGRRETFMGLSGLGDLVLTCTDDLSRNRRFGLALAAGNSRDQALARIGQVVEGLQTASEVDALARRHQVPMPITEQVCRVLYQGADPHEAVQTLFRRRLRAEFNDGDLSQ